MSKDPSRLTRKHRPPRRIKPGEENKERNIEHPQSLAQSVQGRADEWQLREHQGEDASPHRGGEPVRRELTNHLSRTVDAAQGSEPADDLVDCIETHGTTP